MKRIATVILVCLCLLLVAGECSAQRVTVKCPSQAKLDRDGIAACQDTGCGTLDPLLNKQKNTTEGDPDTATDMTFAKLAALPKLVTGYKGIGAPRDALQAKGEGKMVRVVAWALDARPQNTRNPNKRGESCNCGFTGVTDPENTDVHIVLVDDATLELTASDDKSTLKLREAQSQTAEYAPRVRLARGEDFDGSKLKTLIDPNHGGQLHVRVTGLLMYDSEHAVGPFKLLRHTDWEIHPVFRLEYCPDGKTCSADSDANWVDINQ